MLSPRWGSCCLEHIVINIQINNITIVKSFKLLSIVIKYKENSIVKLSIKKSFWSQSMLVKKLQYTAYSNKQEMVVIIVQPYSFVYLLSCYNIVYLINMHWIIHSSRIIKTTSRQVNHEVLVMTCDDLITQNTLHWPWWSSKLSFSHDIIVMNCLIILFF